MMDIDKLASKIVLTKYTHITKVLNSKNDKQRSKYKI